MIDEQGVRRVAETNNWFTNIEWSGVEPIINWFNTNAVMVISVVIFLALVLWGLKKIRQRQDQIQKLWIFILFFLTKRQMMIPLVIRLSEKDNLLDEDLRSKLLEIRQKSRETSFKKNPNERLKIEEQVSKILFFYFSTLDKKNQIKPGTKFAKIAKDLEFIDAKLVQLQKVYNDEANRWNKWINFPVLSLFTRIIGAAPFQAFK